MTIAIVSAGRIRVARNSIQLLTARVKDILTQATGIFHYVAKQYHKWSYECVHLPIKTREIAV